MKKLNYFIVLLIMMIFPSIVLAAGNVTVSTTNISIEEGKSSTLNITATNAAGKVTISSSNGNIASVNKTSEWVENGTLAVTVSGKGVGSTTINVVVDAATFDMEVVKKTYVINVNVKEKYVDTREKNNSLKELSVSPLDIEFKSSKTEYNLKADHDINEITIKATADSSKAKVSGTGKFELHDYNNEFIVKVTAENKSTKTYKIVVARADSEGNYKKLSEDNYLQNIEIEGFTINFSKTEQKYFINVPNSISTLNLNPIVNNEFATFKIKGNNKFKEGINTVEIIVTSEKGQDRIYTIMVNKKQNFPEVDFNNLEELKNIKSSTVIIDIKDDNKLLTKEKLQLLKNSKKEIILNNYDDVGKLSYSWIINAKDVNADKSIDLTIDFANDEKVGELINYANSQMINFAYSGELPKNTKVKIYVGDKFNNNEKIKLYYYDENKNKLIPIEENVKVQDGYATVSIDHCSKYVFTKASIKTNLEPIYLGIIGIETLLLGIACFKIFFKKNKN